MDEEIPNEYTFPRPAAESYGAWKSKVQKSSRLRLVLIAVAVAVFGMIALTSSLNSNRESTSNSRTSTRTTTTTQGTGELVVTVDNPASGSTLSVNTVNVTGKVTSKEKSPLGGAEVTMRVGNQSEVKGVTDEKGAFSVPVKLSPGDNSIIVTAYGLSTWGRATLYCRCDAGASPGAAGQ